MKKKIETHRRHGEEAVNPVLNTMMATRVTRARSRATRAAKSVALAAIRSIYREECKQEQLEQQEKAIVRLIKKENAKAIRAMEKENAKARVKAEKEALKAAEKARAEEFRNRPEERRRSHRSTFLSFCLNDYYRFSEALFEDYLVWKESYRGSALNRYQKIVEFFAARQEAEPIVPILVKNMVGEILPLELQYNPLKMSFDLAKQLAAMDSEAYPLYECKVFRIAEEGPVEEGEIFGLIALAPNQFRAGSSFPCNEGYRVNICLKREGVYPNSVDFYLNQSVGWYYGRTCSVEEIAEKHFFIAETKGKEMYRIHLDKEMREDLITLIHFIKGFFA